MRYQVTFNNGRTEEVEAYTFYRDQGAIIFSNQVFNPDREYNETHPIALYTDVTKIVVVSGDEQQ